MEAALHLDCNAHAEDSCGLIDGCPGGRAFFLCWIIAVKHSTDRIWIFIFVFAPAFFANTLSSQRKRFDIEPNYAAVR